MGYNDGHVTLGRQLGIVYFLKLWILLEVTVTFVFLGVSYNLDEKWKINRSQLDKIITQQIGKENLERKASKKQ